ncbi:MBL fold metallo-hydrolase [Flavobacteriaceae bacterium F89]|uniref:MBL fold metallo-hydrolase n=1 Tax=Cerina litoralis TaxID=2874477 RepID=A0AAE3ES37_9FLAO|nr:MBL fold metallo-hydrolase [Cerina litoralis]MCG2460025.1 MBL fold metallo-hydrolase [Cerina litoralis]
MTIKQFEDKPLAHYSYAILSEGKMALVDPARDPMPYYGFAEENNAEIVAVFETHPHADFVSSHLQIYEETGATIYASKLLGADYPHKAFDDGDSFIMGDLFFEAINTPGHSPDSITVIATDKQGKKAMFTGDTLFVGDVGRPDLREKVGNMKAKREEMAASMYHTIQNKYSHLPDDTWVYPAHGAGSLCGSNLGGESSSTLGNERVVNWAFKNLSEAEFVNHLLNDQPFIPAYFGYDVAINKRGAVNLASSISKVPFRANVGRVGKDFPVVDTRDEKFFKKNRLPNSINIMSRNEDDKIETWLGSIIKPQERFYLVVDSVKNIHPVLERIAKIGYEAQVQKVMTLANNSLESSTNMDFFDFKEHQERYTILDIRNRSEVREGRIFDNAINIPLNELRESIDQVPTSKPVVVHCAGGYRSAAGSSIVAGKLKDTQVFDLGDRVNEYQTPSLRK